MLQYNSEANDQDCVSEILDLCSTTLNVYTLKQITREFNFGLDTYFGWAFEADGQMPYNDFNETSPPIDTQDITATNRYKLGAFTLKIQNIIKIELLDSDGAIVKIDVDTMDKLKTRGDNFDDTYVNAESGIPTKYIILGDFIYFDKIPNWTKVKGLLIYPDRPASYMVVGDTTKVPGVLPLHIKHVCELTSMPYKVKNNLMSHGEAEQLKNLLKSKVQKDFARRTKNQKTGFTVVNQDNQ